MNQQPRILVVDDEPQLARVLRTGLKTHGYEVRVAADGVSALETFTDWRPPPGLAGWWAGWRARWSWDWRAGSWSGWRAGWLRGW